MLTQKLLTGRLRTRRGVQLTSGFSDSLGNNERESGAGVDDRITTVLLQCRYFPRNLTTSLRPRGASKSLKGKNLAERGGFEPPVQLLTVQRFSKPPPSATRPPLRTLQTLKTLYLRHYSLGRHQGLFTARRQRIES